MDEPSYECRTLELKIGVRCPRGAAMIGALLFDMDGTLVDSEPLHHQAWQQTLADYGVGPFPWTQFLGYVGTSNEKVAEDFIRSAGLRAEVADLVYHKQHLYVELIPNLRLLPGVAELLDRVAGSYRMAIVSSSHRLELDKIIERLGLAGRFELVIGGDMVRRKKPEPDIYLEACRQLGAEPRRCAAFEDSEAGVLSAKRAGLTVVAIPNGWSGRQDYSHADLVLKRIDQVDIGTLVRDQSSV